jgi:hypothetical protein
MKIRPVEVELLHVDGRTDRQTYKQDQANSRFFAIFRMLLLNN